MPARRHLLFLDSDMAPDAPDFLARYLARIDAGRPGRGVRRLLDEAGPAARRFALHRALSLRGECLAAAERRCSRRSTSTPRLEAAFAARQLAAE